MISGKPSTGVRLDALRPTLATHGVKSADCSRAHRRRATCGHSSIGLCCLLAASYSGGCTRIGHPLDGAVSDGAFDAGPLADAVDFDVAGGCVPDGGAGPPSDGARPRDTGISTAADAHGPDADRADSAAPPDAAIRDADDADAGLSLDAGAPDALPPCGLLQALDAGSCPPGMVPIDGRFCVDRYEASRAECQADGGSVAYARGPPGRIPWHGTDNHLTFEVARRSCAAAGKRLCRTHEWITACRGPGATTYAYGDTYEPATCNGIDSHCDVGYAGCGLVQRNFQIEATGSYPRCTNAWGPYDMNGNVWEWSQSRDGGVAHGGAFNCGNSTLYTKCGFRVSWRWFQVGFRCCYDLVGR